MSAAIRWQRLWLGPCTALALAALQPFHPSAQAHPVALASRDQLNHAERRALFRDRREWELNSFERRRAMWRNERRCIRHARSPWDLRRCKDEFARALNHLEKDRSRAMDHARRRLRLKAVRPGWGGRLGSSASWRDRRHGYPHAHRQQPILRVDWLR